MYNYQNRKLEKFKKIWGTNKFDDRDIILLQKYDKIAELNNSTLPYSKYRLNDQTFLDLDISNLFPIIDRTTSRIGEQYLFHELRNIKRSEKEIKMLEGKVNFFELNSIERYKTQYFLSFLSKHDAYYVADIFDNEKLSTLKIKTIEKIIPVLSVFFIFCSFLFIKALLFLIPILGISLAIHYKRQNEYKDILKLLTQCNNLIKCVEQLKENVFKDLNIIPLGRLKRNIVALSFTGTSDDIFETLFLFFVLFKSLFLLDLFFFNQSILQIKKNMDNLTYYFEYVGNIDIALSIASLRATQNLNVCVPIFISEEKTLRSTNIYHPFIENCVYNTVNFKNEGVLISGSNMSGKSTFLRTILINSVLAQSINTCFAQTYETSIFNVFSSISITDDLHNNQSLFLKELELIRKMIEHKSSFSNLFIIDEIFKGTNSIERQSLAKATIEYLEQNHSNLILVSSHDMGLINMINLNFNRYFFETDFSYKFRKGLNYNTNAIRIAELIGFPNVIIDKAKCLSKTI